MDGTDNFLTERSRHCCRGSKSHPVLCFQLIGFDVRFGAEYESVVVGLKAVWISHIHADHHVGLPRLLNVRQQLMGPDAPPLLVLGPRPLRRAMMVGVLSGLHVECTVLP